MSQVNLNCPFLNIFELIKQQFAISPFDCLLICVDGDRGVSMEKFVSLWLNNVYSYQNEDELRQLFIKIDALCTGLVNWRDFITYTWVCFLLYDILLYDILLYDILLYGILLYDILLYDILLYGILLYGILLYDWYIYYSMIHILLYDILLYDIAFYNCSSYVQLVTL